MWFDGDRIAAPEVETDTDITISWTGHAATLMVDGQKAFDVDYSAMTELTDKIAMKASTWGDELTDMYVTDPYAPVPSYDVSGKVVDSARNPVADVTARIVSTSNTTGTSVKTLKRLRAHSLMVPS